MNKLETDWINLLVEVCIARNQSWLQNDHNGIKLKEVESILAGGLILRAISILDDSLESYIANNNISIKSSNPKLYHRLEALNNAKILIDFKSIDYWRSRRNEIGHELNNYYKWNDVDTCLNAIYTELNNIKLLKHFPILEATKTIERVEPTKLGVIIEQDVIVKIHEVDSIYHTFSWKIRIGDGA